MRLTIARQALFNAEQETFAYELFFRDKFSKVFPTNLSDKATAQILESLHLVDDIESVSNGHLCFVNFTYDDILHDFPQMLPPETCVMEMSVATPCQKEVVEKVQQLKELNYLISIENLKDANSVALLAPYADYLKVDGKYLSEHYLERIKKLDCPKVKVVATRVETHEEFERIKELGITYFQGFFFEEPVMMEFSTLTLSQMTLSDLLYEASKAEIDLEKIVTVFQRDAALAFKLLRYVQSPVFRRRKQIDNIRQAIIVLGQIELKKFLGLLFAAELSDDKPAELVKTSLVRANFCEKVAVHNGQLDPSVAFMVGLLSLIDTMVDQPMVDLVEKLPVSEEVKLALLRDKESQMTPVLILADCMEKADWSCTDIFCDKLTISQDQLAQDYRIACEWAEDQLSAVV